MLQKKQSSVFCPLCLLQNIVLTLMGIVGLWILVLISVCSPQSAFPFLAGGLFWWQCTLREACKCYDLWLTREPYVCVREREQSHVPRTPVQGAATPALWRTCSTCSVFFCFAPSKQPRLQPAFGVCCTFCSSLCQAERRPQWTRARVLEDPQRIEKERKMEGRREGERRGQRESKIKKKGERIFSLWQQCRHLFHVSMLGSESLPAGPGVRVCS